LNAAEHPSAELLAGYRLQLLDPDELRTVDEHLALCELCRGQVARDMDVDGMAADIRAAVKLPRRTLFRRVIPYAIAASVLIAGGLSLRVANRGASPEAAPEGSDIVRAALRAGRVPLPSFVDRLSGPREVLMGDSPSSKTRPFSPAGTGVLDRAPRFRWDPLPGGWSYEVRVFASGGAEAARSPNLSEPSWTSDRELAAATDYEWQVLASRGDERVTLPAPPQTPPRFRVLEAADAERLRSLAARRPKAHVLLGVEYATAGAVENARAELDQAVRENPGRADIRALLENLPRVDSR
jgi:hypothetical protein